MAVVNTKSTAITNSDATPMVVNPSHANGGFLKEAVGVVEVATSDSANSVFRFARIRSSARVSQILLKNDAQAGFTSADVGLYRTAKDGGAVVDVDAFASAISFASASTAGVDVTQEAADIANAGKRVWELLGLSVDPMVDYDICVTANTIGSAGGTLAMLVRYLDGN